MIEVKIKSDVFQI